MQKVIRGVGIFLAILILVLLILGILNRIYVKNFITEEILLFGLSAVFVITFILDLFPQYISGHALIIIAKLADMDLVWVVIVVICAAFLASVVGFWLGNHVEEETFEGVFGKKLYGHIKKGMNKYGSWYVALSAVSPLPYVPIIFGALGMDWKKFMLYGVPARLIGFVVTGLFAAYALPFVLNFFGG